jgi:hypothetical protein
VREGDDRTCRLDEKIVGDDWYGTYFVFDGCKGSLGTWDTTCKRTRQSCGRGYGGSGRRRVIAWRTGGEVRDGSREADGGGLQCGAETDVWSGSSGIW